MPPELPEWMDTLGQENVRDLSQLLLIDLLAVERTATRAWDIARDLEAPAEDLLMSGAYADTHRVTAALAARAGQTGGVGREACEQAILRLGESSPIREAAALLGDVDAEACEAICNVIRSLGVACVEALTPLVAVEEDTPTSVRAADLIVGFVAPALGRRASLVADPRWFAQRAAARLLGRVGIREAVPPGDGAGAGAEHRRTVAARVWIRGPDARHRQGAHAAGGADQARRPDQGGVRDQ